MPQEQKHYYAFISHSSEDKKTAKWLCKQLEGYHIPAVIQKDHHAPKRLKPIFLFQTDLSGNKLRDALEGELNDSQFLIVICSPSAAKSEYVNKEVKHFIDSGRYDKIIPFIIKGTPYASKNGDLENECFPQALVDLKGKKQELRGIDLLQEQKDRGSKKAAVIDVIASMLGVRMDELWDRYLHERKKKILLLILASILLSLFLCRVFFYVTKLNEEKQLSERELLLKDVEKIANQAITESHNNSIGARKMLKEILPYADRTNPHYLPIVEKALRASTKNSTGLLKFHTTIEWAEYSPSNKYIIVVTQPSSIYIFNTNTLDTIKVLGGIKNIDFSFATFTPDEKYIIAYGDDMDGKKKVYLYGMNSSSAIDSIHSDSISEISVSPRHNQIAVSKKENGNLDLYEIHKGRFNLSATLNIEDEILSHDYMHMVDNILISTSDGKICEWSIDTRRCIRVLAERTKYLEDIICNPLDQYLVGFYHDNNKIDSYLTRTSFSLWSILNPSESIIYDSAHSSRVFGVAFDPHCDYELFISHGLDGKLIAYDIDEPENEPFVFFDSPTKPCFLTSVSYNTSTMQMLWSCNEILHIVDYSTDDEFSSFKDNLQQAHMSLAKHCNYCITADGHDLITRDLNNGDIVNIYELPENIIEASYVDDEHIIISTTFAFNVFDKEENYYELFEREGSLLSSYYHEYGDAAVVVGEQYLAYVKTIENDELDEDRQSLILFNVQDNQKFYQRFDKNIKTLSRICKANNLAITMEDGTIYIYDCVDQTVKDTICEFAYESYSDDIETILSDDYLVIYGFDKSLYIYNLRTQSLSTIENVHKDGVLSVDLSADNTTLLTSSYHGDIKIIDRQTGVVIDQYDFSDNEDISTIPLARFSYDNRYIVFYSNKKIHYMIFKNYSELLKLFMNKQ